MPEKKTRIVLRKKVCGATDDARRSPGHAWPHEPASGRALSGRDDASARTDSGGQMISRGTVSRAGVLRKPTVTYSALAERQAGERVPCSAAWVDIGNPG